MRAWAPCASNSPQDWKHSPIHLPHRLALDSFDTVLKANWNQRALLRAKSGAACHILRAGHVDDQARYYLEETAAKLRAAGYAVTAHVIPGEAETLIADAVKREGIHLLVMGAYGHSPIRAFILGSTTTTMVRTCLVPVLMFR